ncbi:MAG: nucleotidyltransferase family protein [Thermodesulfobacteriota bacterium]
MKQAQVLQVLREYKNNNAEKYGVQKIGLFGSAARGAIDEASDLDIVVRLREQDLFSLIGIKQELEDRLHTKVDVVSYRAKMNSFLKERIDREAVYV